MSEKPIKIEIDLITAYRPVDQMMHAVSMFEDTKRLGVVEKMTLYRDSFKGFDPVKVMSVILQGYKEQRHAVWFMGYPNILDAPIFIEPGISSISDGRSWCMFEDLLDKMSYDSVTDDRRRVLAASNRIQTLDTLDVQKS